MFHSTFRYGIHLLQLELSANKFIVFNCLDIFQEMMATVDKHLMRPTRSNTSELEKMKDDSLKKITAKLSSPVTNQALLEKKLRVDDELPTS